MRWVTVILMGLIALPGQGAPPTCGGVTNVFTPDYSWIVGSANYSDADGDLESGSTFQWTINGTNGAGGAVAEGLLLHFDGSVNGAGSETPTQATGTNFAAGRWNQALALATNGVLRYAPAKNLFLDEGMIEMWVALRANGNDPAYTNATQTLWQYWVSSTNYMAIVQNKDSGVLCAAGTVGQYQSAYSSRASMRAWLSNQWHHLAYTFSTSNNFMRFYLDGVLVADTNEKRYAAPSTNASFFTVGCDRSGKAAYYLLDEVRFSGRVASAAEIAARALRADQPRANEVWLSTASLQAGDTVTFQFTPGNGIETGSPGSASVVYAGIPLTNATPPSTLLAPGTTTLALSVNSVIGTSCRYAVGAPLPFDQMTPFDAGAGGTFHQTTITGLNTNASTINDVYVRCAAYPDFVLPLCYRCLSSVNPPFPRKGNLWGWWRFVGKGLPYMARIDLWLGADGLTADQIVQLRALNPNIRVLSSMNAVENSGLPDDYYLKDVNGQKIEVWPGAFRLNLTKTYVAEYQARYAYQRWLNSGCQADGVFFDNVFLSQSWLTKDIYGNTVQIDADEDGVADDPATLDAAWKAGVLHEVETFRALMPNAIMSGHALDLAEPVITNSFNGISIGFQTANVLEGEQSFGDVWSNYAAWCSQVRAPRYTMVESSPLDDFAYGYAYSPLSKAPTNTVAFAQGYCPWMRFGLAFTLLNDGYFAHEWGDTDHGNDWWYDELDFNLGYPLGPAELINVVPPGANQIVNPGFETAIVSPWSLWADTANGYAATVTRVTDTAAAGAASACVNITATGSLGSRIEFSQYYLSLVAGQNYEVVFWAKASAPRSVTLNSRKGSPNWDNYGLSQTVNLTTNWTEYTVRFIANATVNDARLQFILGAPTGSVWLDDVRLHTAGADVYRREFDNGLVLLNAAPQPQIINLGYGFRRLTGAQAARYEYVLDDSGAAFGTNGAWSVVALDSGEWKAAGPFYHDWGTNCPQSAATDSSASWTLTAPTNDLYTIEAWWPALPSNTWSRAVLYEVVSGSTVLAATNLDQRTGGDQWHTLASVALPAGSNAFVRAHCTDGLVWIADALHVSSAARYNDGSSAPSVTLQPMDGIVLQREPGTFADRDHDGLPDSWEQQYFGNPTDADPAADPDGDGYTNLDEFNFGSSPTNASSVPAALTVAQAEYDFGAVLVGSNATASFTVTNTGPAAFSGTATVSGAPFAIVSGSPFSVPAGGSTNVVVGFTPPGLGGFAGQVVFASNGGRASTALSGAGASGLVLLGAVSRKTHGGAGTFDLNLNMDPAVNPTVEPRLGGPTWLVFTFNASITAADGTLGANEFTLTNATYVSATIVTSNLTLNLTNVVDQTKVTVVLNGVSDLAGNALAGTNAVVIRALYGDVNQSGTVSVGDMQAVKNKLSQTLSSANFLCDVNLSGAISVGDMQVVKNNLSHTVSLAASGLNNAVYSLVPIPLTSSAAPAATLGEALAAPSLVWSTNGDERWSPTLAPDGSSAAWSGSIGDLNVSWVETTVSGPGTLGFEWKVSSELNADFLTFSVDGVDQAGRISGEAGWQSQTVNIPNGSHRLRWTYAKNRANAAGFDAGWLRRVTYQRIP